MVVIVMGVTECRQDGDWECARSLVRLGVSQQRRPALRSKQAQDTITVTRPTTPIARRGALSETDRGDAVGGPQRSGRVLR